MFKYKNRKAFTIIELIVVIVIIGILVLISMPSLLGRTTDAKITVIRHDVKVAETFADEMLARDSMYPENLENSELAQIKTAAQQGKVYNVRGLVTDIKDDEYVILDKSKFGSKLKGSFHAGLGGQVYYEHTNVLRQKKNVASKCPVIGMVPVDLADYLDYDLGKIQEGDMFNATLEDLLGMFENGEDIYLYKKGEELYLYVSIGGEIKSIIFAEISVFVKILTLGPNNLDSLNEDLYYINVHMGENSKESGKLELPEYVPIYNSEHKIKKCIGINEEDEEEPINSNCNLIGDITGETITEYFAEDGYFLTSQNNLYSIDVKSGNNLLLLGRNVGKTEPAVNVLGDMYTIYDTNNGIRVRGRDGYPYYKWNSYDTKIAEGRIKDLHDGLILTTDGRLYDLVENEEATLIDTGVKQLVKGTWTTEGYVNSDNHYVLKDFRNWKDIGEYGNITLVTEKSANFFISNDRLYAWNANGFGLLGNGQVTSPNNVIYEVLLPQGIKIIDIVKFESNSIRSIFALADNGNVYEWGGYNRNINTPQLYTTNVKSIFNVGSDAWGYEDILLHYQDNSTEIIKLSENKKDFYSTSFLSDVTDITHLKSQIMFEIDNDLHLYNQDLIDEINVIENVSEYRSLLGKDYYDFALYYKTQGGKYIKYYYDTHYNYSQVFIDKELYDNELGPFEVYNEQKRTLTKFALSKNKICIVSDLHADPGL